MKYLKESVVILNKLGVKLDSNGFYIGKRENVETDKIINTRDEKDVQSLEI